MFNTLWDLLTTLVPVSPNKFVYLKPSLQECQKRVRRRGRKGESAITLDYQSKLRSLHEKFFAEKRDVIVIEPPLADHDFSKPGHHLDNILNCIIDKLDLNSK